MHRKSCPVSCHWKQSPIMWNHPNLSQHNTKHTHTHTHTQAHTQTQPYIPSINNKQTNIG